MLMRCDKFFVEELQKECFDLDFKRMCDIYQKSRENPAYIRRKQRNDREREIMAKMELSLLSVMKE